MMNRDGRVCMCVCVRECVCVCVCVCVAGASRLPGQDGHELLGEGAGGGSRVGLFRRLAVAPRGYAHGADIERRGRVVDEPVVAEDVDELARPRVGLVYCRDEIT